MATAVIFDMDGVMVDSEIHWESLEKDFLQKEVPDLDEKTFRKFVGMNVTKIYAMLKSKFEVKVSEKDFVEQYNSLAKIVYARASMLPHCLDFIKKLKKENFTLAVASSSPMPWVAQVVGRFELSQLFEKIVSAEHIGNIGKPAPDIYLYTAAQLGKKPEECIAIEDSENGVKSAKAAGMKCIGIRNGFNDWQDISGADLIIGGFDELSIDKVREL